jgi:hypothetical protein
LEKEKDAYYKDMKGNWPKGKGRSWEMEAMMRRSAGISRDETSRDIPVIGPRTSTNGTKDGHVFGL